VLDDREKYLMQRCQDFEVAKNRELDEQEVCDWGPPVTLGWVSSASQQSVRSCAGDHDPIMIPVCAVPSCARNFPVCVSDP